MTAEFVVYGNPLPQPRPRVVKGKAVSNWDPKVKEWRKKVATECSKHFNAPLPGPVGLHLSFCRSNARAVDIDNLAKCVMDAMQGIAYYDDAQVSYLEAFKRIDVMERPYVLITIRAMEP